LAACARSRCCNSEVRAFQRTPYAPDNYPWGATALVLSNVLVFLVFYIGTKARYGMPPQSSHPTFRMCV
jgi:hypothetical protein